MPREVCCCAYADAATARSTRVARNKSRNEQHRRVAQRVSTRLPWSGSASLINRTKAIRRPNSREPAFEKYKPSDFQADPRPQPLLQFVTEATEALILESGKSSGAHACADAYHLTLRVQGLDAVKHHAGATPMAKWFAPAMMSIRSKAPRFSRTEPSP